MILLATVLAVALGPAIVLSNPDTEIGFRDWALGLD